MVILTNEQKVLLNVVPRSLSNNVVPIHGQPTWSSSDTNIISLVVAPDGMSAEAFSANLGNAIVTVSADADLSAGVREISASVDLQVIAAEAVMLELIAGTPVSK